jgi:hypothetical protein
LGDHEGRPYVVGMSLWRRTNRTSLRSAGALCATSGRSETHRNGCVRAERNIKKTMEAGKRCPIGAGKVVGQARRAIGVC